MIQPKTIETIIKVAQPLIECGAIPSEEIKSIQELQQQTVKGNFEILALKTIDEAAQILRTTPKSIHELAKTGELEKIHFSRKKVLIPEAWNAQKKPDRNPATLCGHTRRPVPSPAGNREISWRRI